MTQEDRLSRIERDLQSILEEARQSCDARSDIAEKLAAYQTSQSSPMVPPWVWSLALSLTITAAGAVYVTGQFNGKFEEFRMAVYQRLDRIERTYDSERHRGPENYSPPPVEVGPRPR